MIVLLNSRLESNKEEEPRTRFSRIVWQFPDDTEPPVDDERRPDNASNRKVFSSSLLSLQVLEGP